MPGDQIVLHSLLQTVSVCVSVTGLSLFAVAGETGETFITERVGGTDLLVGASSGEVVDSNNVRISPVDSTSAVIRNSWNYLMDTYSNGETYFPDNTTVVTTGNRLSFSAVLSLSLYCALSLSLL